MTPWFALAIVASSDGGTAAWIGALEAWATVAAVVVTGVTGFLIYLQIRQSAAVIKSTELSIVDGRKTRIDSDMPRLTVVVLHQSEYGFDPSIHPDDRWQENADGDIDDLARYPEGTTFVLPRDAGLLIATSVVLEIHNDGPRRAKVWVDCNFDQYAGINGREELVVNVNETRRLVVRRIMTLEEWIEFAKVHLDGPTESRPTSSVDLAMVTYVYAGDMGAIERHRIEQGGAMLVRDPENAAGWKIAGLTGNYANYPTMNATVHPFERVYYSSLSAGTIMA